MADAMVLVVILTVRLVEVESFRAYEQRAAEIMADYGGGIERIVVVPPTDGADWFKEVHLVRFPDESSFEQYRRDPLLQEIAHLRSRSVLNTEILCGEDAA